MTSVILLHHLDENRAYLNMALQGLKDQDCQFETIVIASSETAPEVESHIQVIHDRSLNTACKKYNAATAFASPKSQFFLFHSDDVILGKDALQGLQSISMQARVIQTPLSNSDIGSRYWLTGSLRPDMELDESALHDIGNVQNRFQGLLIRQDWVSFFCPMISRSIWDEVGPMNEKLESRYCDWEYCLRANRKGIASVINAGAFAFHYGSKTLKKITSEADYAACDKEYLAILQGSS